MNNLQIICEYKKIKKTIQNKTPISNYTKHIVVSATHKNKPKKKLIIPCSVIYIKIECYYEKIVSNILFMNNIKIINSVKKFNKQKIIKYSSYKTKIMRPFCLHTYRVGNELDNKHDHQTNKFLLDTILNLYVCVCVDDITLGSKYLNYLLQILKYNRTIQLKFNNICYKQIIIPSSINYIILDMYVQLLNINCCCANKLLIIMQSLSVLTTDKLYMYCQLQKIKLCNIRSLYLSVNYGKNILINYLDYANYKYNSINKNKYYLTNK